MYRKILLDYRIHFKAVPLTHLGRMDFPTLIIRPKLFQISRAGSLDFLDLKVNGSPETIAVLELMAVISISFFQVFIEQYVANS